MTGEPIGLIAGGGRLPMLAIEGAHRVGRPMVVVGLRGSADKALKEVADDFAWAGVARPNRWIRKFKRHGVREVMMLGGVQKRKMYLPFRLLWNVPDLRAIRVWYGTVRHDKRDNAVLLAVADELASEGIELVSSVTFCQEHLADEGLMTRTPVPARAERDVAFGWHIARASADLDIGQSLAVKECDIIAVEAIEGTDAMIRRAGRLCRTGGWTMVKVARPNQDMRFDVPTVGVETLRRLKDAKSICLVLEADKTLIIDKPQALALADELGIAVIGMRADTVAASAGQAPPGPTD